MPDSRSLKLTLPNDLTYLPIAQSFVRATAQLLGFTEPQLNHLEVAVEEGITNVVKHALAGEEHATFTLICEPQPLGLCLRLREKGMPFDPARAAQYRPEALTEDGSAPAGLGIHLMRKLMDELSFHNLGAEGKETRMLKRLPQRDITSYLPAADLAPNPEPKPQPAAITERIPYQVRRLQAGEAIEVARGAYKSHGYTFFEELIYYPDSIVKLNEAGTLVSVVAVTDDGRFMGHSALLYPEAGARIAELTFVFVDPEYRSQGCFKRMCAELFNTPKRFPLDGIYAYAVTNHPFTQKTMVKYGINDCGLAMAVSPATWHFKGIDGDTSQRMSVVLCYKYLTVTPALTLYPPARHRALIEKLYANIGAPAHAYADPPAGTALPAQAAQLTTTLYPSEGCAELTVDAYGTDIEREVQQAVRDCCLRQFTAIILHLNLEDPLTAVMTPAFEKLGFFFCGILPRDRHGDTLLLQYLNNVALDYSKVIAISPVAQELLAYLQKEDPAQRN